MPGKKHTATNGLSRRGATPEEMEQEAKKEDIDNFIEAQLETSKLFPLQTMILPLLIFLNALNPKDLFPARHNSPPSFF